MYEPDEKMLARLYNDFTYHAPLPGQPVRYEQIRLKAKELAYYLCHATPASREQSLALTHLEEAVFWANAAIARNETEENHA